MFAAVRIEHWLNTGTDTPRRKRHIACKDIVSILFNIDYRCVAVTKAVC